MSDRETESKGVLESSKKDTDSLAGILEVLKSQGEATSNIEADQRNTRRHLLEMKKNQFGSQIYEATLKTNTFIEEFAKNMGIMVDTQESAAISQKDLASGESQQQAEDKGEQQTIFEEIRDSIKGQTQNQGKETAKAASGMMGGLGKMLGGAGLGVGAAGVGIAAVLGAGAYFIKTVEDLDAKKIVANVKELLSISDEMGGEGELFKKGGTFFATMLGIGVGLAAFSVGAGAAAAITTFTEGSNWPEAIKENVRTLLSISELPGTGWDTAGVVATLSGLGIGLALFALGKGVGAVADLGTAGVEKFTGGGNWAQDIKDEVETLLSIGTLGFFDTVGLVATLGGLGLGLVAFAIGKAGSGVGDAMTHFQGGNFAEDIKAEVETLLSISQLDGIGWDTAKFIGVMGGLGAGLLAFSMGKGAAGTADAVGKFSAGDNFAEDIKAEVETLLAMGAQTDMGQVDLTVEALAKLGAGLAAFATGKGLNVLADVGAAVVGFFTGTMSPIEQALALADRADEIDEGVNAFNRFGDVLERFTGIKGVDGDWALEDMADDLLAASKILNIAIAGGTDYRGKNKDYVGISNIEGIDEALKNMALLKSAFSIEAPTTGLDMSAAAQSSGGSSGGTAVITSDNSNSSVNTQSTTIITTPQMDTTTLNLASAGGGPGF